MNNIDTKYNNLQRPNAYEPIITERDVYFLKTKRNVGIYIYYILMLCILISWTNVKQVSPTMISRVIYTVMFFIPFIKNIRIMPFAIITFWSIRIQSVAPFGYLPTDPYLYLLGVICVLLVRTMIYQEARKKWLNVSDIGLLMYILVMDTIHLDIFSTYLQMILLGVLLYNQVKTKEVFHLLALSFTVFSFVESIYFFIFRNYFTTNFISSVSGLERSSWVDPNYFGIILGSGIIISLTYLLGYLKVKLNIFFKLFFIVTILLTFITIVLQASRGTILAVGFSSILLILFSKLKSFYKILISILTVAFILYLFNNNYFELLVTRIETDDGTGSGRVDIWLSRLAAFKNENPLSILFGLGREYGLTLGTIRLIGTHNEFISTLVIYGIVGLLILLYLLWYPIKVATKNNRVMVIIFISYLVMCFMTLEPITFPYILVIMFYCLTLLIAKNKEFVQ